jgi:predicted outer membrane protein
MADKMIDKHSQLGKALGELAQDKGGRATATLSDAQRAILMRVAAQTGADFDAVFKRTVDEGHVQELAMYRAELSRARDPRLRTLVQDRVTKLQATVAQSEKPQHEEW